MTLRQDKSAEDWPLRPWFMAAICAAAGLSFHFLIDHDYGEPVDLWRQAGATLVAVAAFSFVLTVERKRWTWSLAFAAGWGLVLAMVGWFTAAYNQIPTIFEWPYLSGLFAVLLAAPLFQTMRDEGAWAFPYARLHNHAWNDAVIGAASLGFTGIAWLLAWLIAGLFNLIGIDFFEDLLNEEWFGWPLTGFAFGAAVGLLRERDALVGTLQRLATVVLAVLAPVLAAALAAFLLSLPFTGLDELWDSVVPATPLMLVAGAGAILLGNAVIGNGEKEGGVDDRPASRVLRWSALALTLTIFPLAIIAAASIGQRIGQYGWTPERIWGVVAVTVAIAYGLAGWWSVAKGRAEFDDALRPLQTKLALGLCGVALLLALPIVDFGAISARSQLARLQSGSVKADEFDWAAMAFDFGQAGRDKLQQIAASRDTGLRRRATAALRAKVRYDLAIRSIIAGPAPVELEVFGNASVPAGLREKLLVRVYGSDPFCSEAGACRVYPQSDGSYIVLMDKCANIPAERRDDPDVKCARLPGVFALADGKWANVYETGSPDRRSQSVTMTNEEVALSLKVESEALDRGDVRIVTVERRQLEIGGKRRGDVF